MTTDTLVTVCDKVPAIRQPYEIDSQDNVPLSSSRCPPILPGNSSTLAPL